MKRKLSHLIGLGIMTIVLLYSCGSSNNETDQINIEEKQKPRITVDKATYADVEQTNSFTGTVESKVSNNIAPQSNIRIEKLYAEVGDHVVKGQKLVDMDHTALNQAKYQMDNNRIEFERVDELYKVGGTSKSDWDAKKLALDLSESNYKNLSENSSLLSPITGIITTRNYDNGDMYSTSGNPIFTVEQIKPVKLMINVSEILFTKIKKGMSVDVVTDVYGDQVFEGKVTLIHPKIDPSTRTFPVEIELTNSDEKILPGMFARVNIAHGKESRIVISDRAIVKQTGSGNRFVYVYKDGAVTLQVVELGQRVGNMYEIISGINDGDVVAVTGQNRLNDGIEVEIIK